jgi:hypothetical protein
MLYNSFFKYVLFYFEKLLFWQKSIELAKKVYIICAELPKDEKFGLISQIKRCVISFRRLLILCFWGWQELFVQRSC